MIELNLLPEELKKKKRKIELPEIPIIPIVIWVVAGMVAIQLILGGLIYVSKSQLTRLGKEWESLAPKKSELDEIKKNIADIDKKGQAIDELIVRRLRWSGLLNEISDSLTANIWLREFFYSERNVTETVKGPKGLAGRKPTAKKTATTRAVKVRTLTLSGYALGKGGDATDYITRFVESLKDNKGFAKHFAEIGQGPIKKAIVEGQEVMSFAVICKFNPEKKGR
ncbi:MAG: hypothetical protein ISS90_00290 [Candidatus Omnitrophica bacterium]|nr:hypothetical protein [Candidatus Omnitrophota bacterium]